MSSEKRLAIFYKFGIGCIFGVVFGLIYLLIRMDFSLAVFADAFLLTAFFLFVVSLCSWVNNEGFFDMMNYGFQQIPFMLHMQKTKKYEDLIAYKDAKNIKRVDNKLAPFGYLLTTILFLVIGIILYIIYKFGF